MTDNNDIISATDIETLGTEAAAAGDTEQVALCEQALAGSDAAWAACAAAISDARATEVS